MKKLILIAGLILIVGCGKSGSSDQAVADCVRYNSERIVDREPRMMIDVASGTFESESTRQYRGQRSAKNRQFFLIEGCKKDINFIY